MLGIDVRASRRSLGAPPAEGMASRAEPGPVDSGGTEGGHTVAADVAAQDAPVADRRRGASGISRPRVRPSTAHPPPTAAGARRSCRWVCPVLGLISTVMRAEGTARRRLETALHPLVIRGKPLAGEPNLASQLSKLPSRSRVGLTQNGFRLLVRLGGAKLRRPAVEKYEGVAPRLGASQEAHPLEDATAIRPPYRRAPQSA